MEQKEVTQIARKLGRTLVDSGVKMLKSAFKLTPSVYSKADMQLFLNGLAFPSTSLSDEKYYVVGLEDWKNIIAQDWIGEKKYMVDVFDCDDYGFGFSSYASYVFDLNTAGVAYGAGYNADTGAWVLNHAFNLIITLEDGALVPYLYEPATHEYAKWVKGKNILPHNNWEYRINWVILF